MDTRFWGPSGWQLLHLVAADKPDARFFELVPKILPCKFCRQSTIEFEKQMPVRKPYDKWIYDLHNMVNAKLRDQVKEDPNVIVPPPDPSFEEVKTRYEGFIARKPCAPPGLDFLLTLAYNYKYTEIENKEDVYSEFFGLLKRAYPYEFLRKVIQDYPSFDARDPFRWMYGLAEKLCDATGSRHMLSSYHGLLQRLAFYKSGCTRKTYRGKTCRKVGGKHTKVRDNKRTYRITHRRLLR